MERHPAVKTTSASVTPTLELGEEASPGRTRTVCPRHAVQSRAELTTALFRADIGAAWGTEQVDLGRGARELQAPEHFLDTGLGR